MKGAVRTRDAQEAILSSQLLLLKRRLLAGSAWASGGKLTTALFVLVANAMLARLLSPQELGAYFLAFSVVSIGALVGSLGLNQAAVRFLAESVALNRLARARRVVAIVCGLGVLGALGTGFAYSIFGHTIGSKLFHSSALAAITGLVAVWIIVMVLQTLLAETFRGFHDIRLATIFGGLATWGLMIACLALLSAVKGKAGLTSIVLLATASGLTSVLLAGWLLKRKVSSLPHGEEHQPAISEVLRVTLPLLISNATLFIISQADLWIMGALRPQDEVAIYGAALRVVTLVVMPLIVVNSVVPPLIAEMHVQARKEELEHVLRLTATLTAIPALLILSGFVLFGGPILSFVFGDYYGAGATVLALLSFGQLVNVWAGSCGMVLMMTGHQVTMTVITGACSLLIVAIGLLVVRQYGAIGMAVTASLGLTLQNVLMWLGVRYTIDVRTHVDPISLYRIIRTIAAGR